MRRTALILFLISLVARLATLPFMSIPYDEAAYAWTARNLAANGGWLDLYGSDDLFFFPPLFNYLAALVVKLGVDRLYAVRLVTILFSSGIPPLIYLLAVRSGLTARAGLIAAALWLLLPWGWHLSVVGMVETPWICGLLASLYFLQGAAERGSRRDALFAAFFFLAALWIKETALGAVPLFMYALWRHKPLLRLWCAVAAAGFLPLAAQSILPHSYDLFYEITTPIILWNNFSADPILVNWGVIQGTALFPWSGWSEAFLFFTLLTAALALLSMSREEWRDRFVLRVAAGFLIIYLPFFMTFPKKFPYYLLPVYLFAAFFLGRFLAARPRLAAIYLAAVLLFAAPAVAHLSDRSDENDYRIAAAMVEQETPGARIGITLPRKAEYVVEKAGLPVNFDSLEWMHCAGKGDECLFRNGYLISDPMFLLMLYCRQWPMGPDTCDLASFAAAKQRLVPLYKGAEFTLYRIEKPSAPPAP